MTEKAIASQQTEQMETETELNNDQLNAVNGGIRITPYQHTCTTCGNKYGAALSSCPVCGTPSSSTPRTSSTR